jgi:hypothetical protein
MPKMHVSEVLVGAGGAKGGEKRQSRRPMPGALVAPSTKKCIILAIEALAKVSLDGTVESSLHDREPEVQSKMDARGPPVESQTRSAATSGPRHAPKVSLWIVPSTGTARDSTSCFWI